MVNEIKNREKLIGWQNFLSQDAETIGLGGLKHYYGAALHMNK